MISLQLVAFIVAVFLVCLGLMYSKMKKLSNTNKELEKTLTNSSRELASMETLNTEFLNKIGNAFNLPLKAIEASSKQLTKIRNNLPEEILKPIIHLSDEVSSLLKILNVIEDISSNKKDSQKNSTPKMFFIQFDELVSEIAIEMSEAVADEMVSFSLSICGSVRVFGIEEQLREAISLILKEALKYSVAGSILDVELRIRKNVELEARWQQTDLVSAETEILSAGFIRLIASSHGGWLNIDIENGHITLVLPNKGEVE